MRNEGVHDAVVPYVVTVEEDRDRGYYGEDDHRWSLVRHDEVAGGAAAAEEEAERLAREHIPADHRVSVQYHGRPGRRIFRLADGSWLVETWIFHRNESVLFKVSTGRLVHEEDSAYEESAYEESA
ncbi:hypothetical protein ACFVZH_34800 [Streptomyces sp. NPDC059534]|uniref:hypothetical protein n=1 Tax=Streptomyces sp. NPDC059534 TaxID=3346859 RepID=UPI00369D6E40